MNPFKTLGGRSGRARPRRARVLVRCAACGRTSVASTGPCGCRSAAPFGATERGADFFVWDEDLRAARDWAVELRTGSPPSKRTG
jgi:hypothetical protein